MRPRARARIVGALCILVMLCACSERTPAVPAQAGKGAAATAPTSAGVAPAGTAPSVAADKPDTPATPTSPDIAQARAAPSQADFEALVQRIDDDLRANRNLSDSDRQRLARQFAQEFVDNAADWQNEEERNRRFQQKFTATWGSVEDVKARECAAMRAQLDVLQRRADGTSSKRLTEAERAALPDEIGRMTERIEQVCR